jgi:hypothetical protein
MVLGGAKSTGRWRSSQEVLSIRFSGESRQEPWRLTSGLVRRQDNPPEGDLSTQLVVLAHSRSGSDALTRRRPLGGTFRLSTCAAGMMGRGKPANKGMIGQYRYIACRNRSLVADKPPCTQ